MRRFLPRFLMGIALAVFGAGAAQAWRHDVAFTVFVGAMVAITVWTKAIEMFLDVLWSGICSLPGGSSD
ncbi:hypothetical protein ACFQ6C_25935 [Streptomyces sp. NPDC056454]|uniref:hypothetical protein n=1 Tax=Streptomyces sp. NPDC056454 TaxID=3345823 RepID=UPI0036BF8A4D